MALSHVTVYILATVTLVEASSLLQRVATRQRSFVSLRYSPQDPAARTLLTLDTNHDGSIDPNEVAAFAHLQGLDSAAATEEFSSIDTNGDGVLDSIELQKVLGTPSTELASKEVTVEPPTAAQATPVSLRSAPAEAVEVEAPVAASAREQKEAAVQAAVAPISQQQEAELPAAQSLVAARNMDTSNAELMSEESRNSVRMAAQKVAEELELEEKEEMAARKFDRKAAELRANSTALAKLTVQDALDAGAKAAHKKADELMAKISKLEDEAERAEVRAAALRAKSKMEMEEGNQLMAAAEQSLKQAP